MLPHNKLFPHIVIAIMHVAVLCYDIGRSFIHSIMILISL